MVKKIQIKDVKGKLLFEYEKENNTIKDTLEEGVRQGIIFNCADLRRADLYKADLRGANLREANLYKADLRGANLSGADLLCAYLREANLSNADLSKADLCYSSLYKANLSVSNLLCAIIRMSNIREADLHESNFYCADLRGADLSCANIRKANLRKADIRCSYLRYANLHEADLYKADISGADFTKTDLSEVDLSKTDISDVQLSGAKNIPYIPMVCPSEGAFIGWKKLKNHLVKLEIPEDAKRSSATTNKCRCSKAKVLSITDLDGRNPIDEIVNDRYKPSVIYKVGEMVYPDSFDENRWNDCSNGIHFFVKKFDAINY